jgi:hypothetical protein
MHFTDEIKKSIYNKEFYEGLKSGSTREAMSYFFRLSCFLALLSTIIFSIFFIPRFMRITSQESVDSLVAIFPKELTLTIQAGHLSTNVPEPYIIKMPTSINGTIATSSLPAVDTENLAIIATKENPNISDIGPILTQYRSHILVTGTDIISKDSNGKTTVQSLASFPNTTINQDSLKQFVDKIRPYVKFIVPISIPFIFLGFVVYFSTNLIFGLILALLILIMAKVFKWELDYKHAYGVGLHSMTLPLLIVFLINTIISFVPFTFFLPRFTFSLLALIIIYLNLRIPRAPKTAEIVS